MNNLIEDPLYKIKRANYHIVDLEEKITLFSRLNPCSIVIEKDEDTGDKLVKVKLTSPLPEMLPGIIGDALCNIRSSLDHLAVALILHHTGKRPINVYFPIYYDEANFEKNLENMKKNYSNVAIDIIKEIKPYKGANDLLWCIHNIRNFENHNFIVPIGIPSNITLLQGMRITNAKTGIIFSGPGRLDEGIIISNLGTEGTIAFGVGNGKNIMVDYQISFDNVEVDLLKGKPALENLKRMSELAKNIILRFGEKCFN